MLSRRNFLGGATLLATGAHVPLRALFGQRARAQGRQSLVQDPNGVLDLPPGFSYRILERGGDPMDDGYRVPGLPDGMACFDGGDGTWVLMRNHEVSLGDSRHGPFYSGQEHPAESYDRDGYGGVSRVVVDACSYERVSSNLVLIGTERNCAGGPSPWGWLTCEETVNRRHGYVFLCDIHADRVQAPQRIVGYGRFNHEAAAVDPATNVAYLTEDRNDSCLYRFVPDRPEEPFVGQLQAMRIRGRERFATYEVMRVGERLEVEWVPISDTDPRHDTVRHEAQGRGAAVIARGEGIWYVDGRIYVCATAGGPRRSGQIFVLEPDQAGDSVTLLAQSEHNDVLDAPDNITVAPWGEVFMAEDGGGRNAIRILRPSGEISEFARNALSSSEIAGVCFSPDGQVLFCNLQKDHLTLAITGPFPRTAADRCPARR
jgi:uncharacterized protein